MTERDIWEIDIPDTFESVEQVVVLVDEMAALFRGFSDGQFHQAADRILVAALRAAAAGHPSSSAIAAAALRTQDIGFARWYE